MLNGKGGGFLRQEVTQSAPQWRGAPQVLHMPPGGLQAEEHSPGPKQGFGWVGEVGDLLFSFLSPLLTAEVSGYASAHSSDAGIFWERNLQYIYCEMEGNHC